MRWFRSLTEKLDIQAKYIPYPSTTDCDSKLDSITNSWSTFLWKVKEILQIVPGEAMKFCDFFFLTMKSFTVYVVDPNCKDSMYCVMLISWQWWARGWMYHYWCTHVSCTSVQKRWTDMSLVRKSSGNCGGHAKTLLYTTNCQSPQSMSPSIGGISSDPRIRVQTNSGKEWGMGTLVLWGEEIKILEPAPSIQKDLQNRHCIESPHLGSNRWFQIPQVGILIEK
jgi:hypothetical protein